jgi:hypothetical protein
MSYIVKGSEIINNLFTMMEGDATPDHIDVQIQKGK